MNRMLGLLLVAALFAGCSALGLSSSDVQARAVAFNECLVTEAGQLPSVLAAIQEAKVNPKVSREQAVSDAILKLNDEQVPTTTLAGCQKLLEFGMKDRLALHERIKARLKK